MIFMMIKQFIVRKYRFNEISILSKVDDYIYKNNETFYYLVNGKIREYLQNKSGYLNQSNNRFMYNYYTFIFTELKI